MKKLQNESIEADLQLTTNELRRKKYSRWDTVRISLLTEEILLKYRDQFGEDVSYEVGIRRRFVFDRIVITVEGPRFDCRDGEPESEEDLLQYLSKGSSQDFAWQYKNGCNIITILLPNKKTLPDIVRVVLAVFLAVGAFFLCRLLPSETQAVISDQLIPGLYGIMYDILIMIAAFLIFFSVLSGIIHISSLEQLKSVLKRVGSRAFLNSFGIIAVYAIVLLFFVDSGSFADSFSLNGVLQLFADMIPRNVFSPFIDGNIMEVTVLALAIGILLLAVGENGSAEGTIDKCQRIVSHAMQFFCKYLPLLVFLNIYSVIPSFSTISPQSILLPSGIAICVILVIMVVETVEICLNNKLRISEYVKTIMPATIITLATASSTAAIDAMKKAMKKLGVAQEHTNLILPLVMAFYKPFAIIIVFAGVSTVSMTLNHPLSVGMILNLSVLALIIAFACPAIPGGMLSCLSILSSQLLLPEGSMGILILIATVFDYIGGAFSVYSLQTETAGLGFRFGRKTKK